MGTQTEQVSAEKLLPGRPMKYDIFIKALKLYELYSPHMAAKHGEYLGFFNMAPFDGEDAFRKARNSLSGFCRLNLPEKCDHVVETPGYKSTKSWYGWRWKRALSPTFFTKKEWRAVTRAENRHKRRQARSARKEAFFHGFRSKKLILSLFLLIVFSGVAVQHYRPANAWRVWKEEGPRAFMSYLKDPRTNDEKFMQAWAHYDRGDLEVAQEMVTPLLNLKLNSKIKGDAYYLKGLLATYSHAPDTLDFFGRAIEIYEERKAFNSQYNVYLSMADYVIKLDDLWLAENYIDLARGVPASNPDVAYFHEVQSELFLRNGDYKKALETIQKSLDLYQGRDLPATARVLSDIGFLQVLMGEYEKGLANSLASEKLVLEIGDTNMYFYNKINFYLWSKCTGRFEEGYRNLVLERVQAIDDQVLMEKFSFAEQHACILQASLVGDDHPPPPPPDNY